MKIRLIALDIDGTLLDDRKELPPENREALQEAERRGLTVCIASGRMVSTIEAVERRLGVDCILIAYNGALVMGRKAEGRQAFVHRPVDAGTAEHLVHFARAERRLLNFYHEDRLYAEEAFATDPMVEIYTRRTGAAYNFVPDLLESFPGVRPTKLILLAETAVCDRLLPGLRRRLEGRACIAKSDPEYIEITASGVDKGSALPLIEARYGVDPGEVMAVGDAENDLSLIRAAGLGVAVANARPAVKAAARHVTDRTNNEGGAAEAIRRWALA